MSTLLIDTATDHLVVALARDAQVLDASSAPGRAQSLPVLTADLLDRNGLAARDLTGIAVGTGPGAFTGLRIGVAFARGLAAALELPLMPISTLLALVHTTIDEVDGSAGGPFAAWAAIDARRGEWFVTPVDGIVMGGRVEGARLLDPLPRTIVTSAQLDDMAARSLVRRGAPSAAALARLAVSTQAIDPQTVLPDYGRAPDAVPGTFAGVGG